MNPESSNLLSGKTIVITRSQDQQAEARQLFEKVGAKVLELPALEIGPPDSWEKLDNALKHLEDFGWIIFSSSNGVKAVQSRLELIGASLNQRPSELRIAAVGRKTAMALKNFGAEPDFVPPKFVAESLIKHFPLYSAQYSRVLLPRVQSGGRTIISKELTSLGMDIVEVPAYESQCPKKIPALTLDAFIKSKVDLIAFTSGKTVSHTVQLFSQYFGKKWMDKFKDVKLISIGPQTTISCKKYFQRVDNEARNYDLEGLVNASIEVFNSR